MTLCRQGKQSTTVLQLFTFDICRLIFLRVQELRQTQIAMSLILDLAQSAWSPFSLFQTLNCISTEKNQTVVFPLPIDLVDGLLGSKTNEEVVEVEEEDTAEAWHAGHGQGQAGRLEDNEVLEVKTKTSPQKCSEWTVTFKTFRGS